MYVTLQRIQELMVSFFKYDAELNGEQEKETINRVRMG